MLTWVPTIFYYLHQEVKRDHMVVDTFVCVRMCTCMRVHAHTVNYMKCHWFLWSQSWNRFSKEETIWIPHGLLLVYKNPKNLQRVLNKLTISLIIVVKLEIRNYSNTIVTTNNIISTLFKGSRRKMNSFYRNNLEIICYYFFDEIQIWDTKNYFT